MFILTLLTCWHTLAETFETSETKLLPIEEIQTTDYGKSLIQTINLQLASGPSDVAIELLMTMKERILAQSLEDSEASESYKKSCDKSLNEYEISLKATSLQHDIHRNDLEQLEKKKNQWTSQLNSYQRDLKTANDMKKQVLEKISYEKNQRIDLTQTNEQILLQINNPKFLEDKIPQEHLDNIKNLSKSGYFVLSLLENNHEIDYTEFIQSEFEDNDQISQEFLEGLQEYLHEINKEIEELEGEIAVIQDNANFWNVKVAECRAMYEESERRLLDLPKVINEKEKMCEKNRVQAEAERKRKEHQVLVIDSAVYIVQNKLDELNK
ncbi:hypothetical protein SteCoe_25714 [Stentor coeruleus]|uniref:BZIP domain-containing protein n=1 Tax=Stentor coeruleus TaxID=5963 RepID=A0A1R2BEK8_9CILI|nr:hypothetical protein SteCoe_25714 [Stentor coeruleus]